MALASIAGVGYTQHIGKPVATAYSSLHYVVQPALEWNALLKRSTGWFGGDGIFTIPLSGAEHRQARNKEKVLFIFSDTMVGDIKDSARITESDMIHNSAAILTGNRPDSTQIKFYWDKSKSSGKPRPLFVPQTPKTKKGDYFWLGDGFVNHALNNNLYIFGYRIHNVDTAAFGFKEVGNVLIKVPAGDTPPYKRQQQYDTPFYVDRNGDTGSFGAGIYVNTKWAAAPHPDGYVYVYGVVGKYKQLLVARVKAANFDDYDKWTYWDGKTWNKDMAKAAKIADWVSNELSVSALPDGRYALVFQIGTITKDVGLRVGKTPYGPFGPAIKIWDCSKDLTKKTYMVYNAKAHPSLSGPDELLISYNINSTRFFTDIKADPNLYRPRFIKLKFK